MIMDWYESSATSKILRNTMEIKHFSDVSYSKPSLCGFLQSCASEGEQIVLTPSPGNKTWLTINKSFVHIKVLFERKIAVNNPK